MNRAWRTTRFLYTVEATAERRARRERVVRVWWAIGGAIGAAALAVVVNVVSEQVNLSLTTVPEPTPSCASNIEGTVAGREGMQIWLSPSGERCWVSSLDTVRPGDEFDVRLQYFNATSTEVKDVHIVAYVPDGFELVANTSELKNSSNPDWKKISDRILDPGINIGSYTAGSNAFVRFSVRVSPDFAMPCGGISVYPISTRLPDAAIEFDTGWVSSSVVSNGNC